MSKMGQVNFDLQEQAEELGFETVQEAMDNGYKVFIRSDGTSELSNRKTKTVDVEKQINEMMSAHQQYEADKRRILNNLEMLLNDTPYTVYRKVLSEAIDFFKQKEI